MVQHHRALTVIARPTGERLHILFKLLDQALLVRGDNIHSPLLAAQQLKSGYSKHGAMLLIAGNEKGRPHQGPPSILPKQFGLEDRHIGFVANEPHL
jgi:hypothetical protein